MAPQLVVLFALLLVASARGDAAPTPEVYWKLVLPNTSMPSSISQLLKTRERVGAGEAIGVPTSNNAFYKRAATEAQLQDDFTLRLFFLEEDLHSGKKFKLHFLPTAVGGKFLPRHQADAIPFSLEELPAILRRFSVSPNSAQAVEMRQTLHDCEEPAAKGEKAECTTSLESMVDFVVTNLGTSNVQAASTVVGKSSPTQEYTVLKHAAVADHHVVICHPAPYVYSLFYCHATAEATAYSVSLVGTDGGVVEAVAVCHCDTTAWNPHHIAFKALNVMPGAPVCHFMQPNQVVWTRSA